MPTHIHTVPKLPAGMKKAPIVKPITIKYLMPQNPFCIGALASRDDLAPNIMIAIREKKHTMAKQMR